eukprot:CAMPEP_0173415802 /NCGR_PEP_ID=MMETSP1356-20130122/85057_1 /TAXON_ID=77927 ORGANISM="Hemiselmis virescens, Strain PCC157" /NCGR_SAMPLE_ID=MMETSP1356 /ASSEMBLY_ACC=CAM_ASM_000847 /LENGTH=88 /DNA_ID=CAMNT_0014378079 /DNA_START=1399 /DNA_END=1662 /DNA_ORIENTATION=+
MSSTIGVTSLSGQRVPEDQDRDGADIVPEELPPPELLRSGSDPKVRWLDVASSAPKILSAGSDAGLFRLSLPAPLMAVQPRNPFVLIK